LDEFADSMDVSHDPWDGATEAPKGNEESRAGRFNTSAPAETNDSTHEKLSPKDEWDDPGEGQRAEDPWDNPREEKTLQDPWDSPEEETDQTTEEQKGETPEQTPAEEDPPAVQRLKGQVERLEREAREQNKLASLLEKSAKRMGLTPEGYLTHLRQHELMALGLSADGAAIQAKVEQQAAGREVETARQRAVEERQKTELRRFVEEFPHVKPEKIGKEVWAAARRGESLTAAYLRAENKRLSLELSAQATRRKNEGRATGSRKDAGGDSGSDGFLRGFLSD
jgi:hypothetical protein